MTSHEPTIQFGAWDCKMTPGVEHLTDWRHSCQITIGQAFTTFSLVITTSCLNIIKEYLHIGTIVHLRSCLDRLLGQLKKELNSDLNAFNYEISFGDWRGPDYHMLSSSIESNRELTLTLQLFGSRSCL